MKIIIFGCVFMTGYTFVCMFVYVCMFMHISATQFPIWQIASSGKNQDRVWRWAM